MAAVVQHLSHVIVMLNDLEWPWPLLAWRNLWRHLQPISWRRITVTTNCHHGSWRMMMTPWWVMTPLCVIESLLYGIFNMSGAAWCKHDIMSQKWSKSDSLTFGRNFYHFNCMIFYISHFIEILSINYEISLRWLPQDLTAAMWTFLQLVAWRQEGTSH